MTGSLQISTEALRKTGTALGQVGDQLDAALRRLEAELKSFGQPWGNDEIGQLIGVAYEEVVSFAFECLREVLAEIRESGTDLGAMADRYDQAEQDFMNSFKALLQQLGSG